MFQWFSKLEDSARAAIASVSSNKIATSVWRGVKAAGAYELGYVLTHVSNPTSGAAWQGAAIAGALLGLQKLATWQDSSSQQ